MSLGVSVILGFLSVSLDVGNRGVSPISGSQASSILSVSSSTLEAVSGPHGSSV